MAGIQTSFNQKNLEFAIFCIENVADYLGIEAKLIYDSIKKSNIIDDYIIPEYEVLHSQSKEYIVKEIIDVMKERGVDL